MYQTILVKFSESADLEKMAGRIWDLSDAGLIEKIEIVQLSRERPLNNRRILVTLHGDNAYIIDACIKDMHGVNSLPNHLEYTRITTVVAQIKKTQ